MLTFITPSFIYPANEFTLDVTGIVDGLTDTDMLVLNSLTMADVKGNAVPCQFTLYGPHGVPAIPGPPPWYPPEAAPLWVKATANPPVGTGAVTLTAVFSASSVEVRAGTQTAPTQTLTLPLKVRPVPAPQRAPIPNLASWESNMLTGADHWSAQILDPNSGIGGDAWVYDMSNVFWQVCDYTQSNKYAKAALASAAAYSAMITPTGGQTQGYYCYTRGLRACYERTQDPQWLTALLLMANDAYVKIGGDPDAQYIRETAFAAMAWMDLAHVGAGNTALLQQCIEFLLGHIDQLFIQELGIATDFPVNEPFFAGIAGQALIDYYEQVSPDPRIPEALKLMARYIWDHAVDPSTGMVDYDIWTPDGRPTDPAGTVTKFCGLNMLMVNIWGFLWKLTCDPIYQVQGDCLFMNFAGDPGSLSNGIDYSAKQWAQKLWRCFDYVLKYRG